MKWMTFIDGENLTIRAQRVSHAMGFPLEKGPYYRQDCFVWPRGIGAYQLIGTIPLRAYYYTSVQGDHQAVQEVRLALRQIGFAPKVFAKTRGQKAKGVDITLTKDMLVHAFTKTMDGALLVAGDGDYVPLVEEVKRHGIRVDVAFFKNEGLSPELALASDVFLDITDRFANTWIRA